MPDIKTALLNAWAKDEEQIIKEKVMTQPLAHRFKPTNNVSRETFNYIRNNPNLTTNQVCSALAKQGFKEGSVTSICAQLSKQGQVIKDAHTKRLVAISNEYKPLKAAATFRSKPQKTVKIVKRVVPEDAGLAALAPQDKVDTSRSTIVLNRNWTAQGVVDKLSVVQARALYDLLKQIFGG